MFRIIPSVITVLLGHSMPALADSSTDMGQHKSAQCIACHGARGTTSNPTFPHLAGQNSTYLSLQLRKFRSGERYDPLMSPIAQTLTDEDIHDLAAYYAAIPLRPADE